MINKNLIFTITHGRTGTTLLTNIFTLFLDTRSEHEPEPNYASIHPAVKNNPRHAIEFLERKLNHIGNFSESNYVETSNVFGKAFIIPLIRLGITPNLILLNRDFRKVATSLFQRGSTPMRTKMGSHFSADPSKAGSLPIFDPEGLSDYQLCFWGVLDSFKRQKYIERLYQEKLNKSVIWITAEELSDYEKVVEMGRALGLTPKSDSKEIHTSISQKHHNPNAQKKSTRGISFDNEEIEVIDRIAYYDPLFIDDVLSSTLTSKSLKDSFK